MYDEIEKVIKNALPTKNLKKQEISKKRSSFPAKKKCSPKLWKSLVYIAISETLI